MAERDRQRGDRAVVVDQAVELGALLLAPPRRVSPTTTKRAGQDLHVLGVAAELLHAALHVGVEALAAARLDCGGEHHLGGLGRELAAGLGGAGLHDHRPALDRPRDVERAAHREVLALVAEHVHLLGIEEDAALDVAHEGVVGEAVPQAGHHVVELARAPVALVVLHVLVEAEVQRGVRVGGGDDVPAGAAAADVVERGEAAGDVVGRVEGGRAGGDQADVLGRLRQRRQQGERLERGHRVAALQRIDRHVEHGQVVGHEEGVELARRSSVCAKRLRWAKLKLASG